MYLEPVGWWPKPPMPHHQNLHLPGGYWGEGGPHAMGAASEPQWCNKLPLVAPIPSRHSLKPVMLVLVAGAKGTGVSVPPSSVGPSSGLNPWAGTERDQGWSSELQAAV